MLLANKAKRVKLRGWNAMGAVFSQVKCLVYIVSSRVFQVIQTSRLHESRKQTSEVTMLSCRQAAEDGEFLSTL